MKKIENRFLKIEGYNCFGCSPDNESGLKLEFFQENDCCIALFKPDNKFCGYKEIIHGGIQATIIDEVGAWAVDTFYNKTVLTKTLKIDYIKPLYSTKGNIFAKAKIEKIDEKYADVYVEIYTEDNVVTTKGYVLYRIVGELIANELLNRK